MYHCKKCANFANFVIFAKFSSVGARQIANLPARFGGGEGAGVLFGLAAGAEERVVPGGGATGAVAAESVGAALSAGGREGGFCILPFDALLGFEDEAAAFVEVNAAIGLGAVGVGEDDAALEDVGVDVIVGARGVGVWDVEDIAQLAEEQGVIRSLGTARGGPTVEEGLDGGARHARRNGEA